QLEGVHGIRVVGGDEHDRWWGPEPGQHLRELEPGQPRHLDVEEDAVDLLVAQDTQRVGRGVAGQDVADAGVLPQQELQVVEGGPLVVDDEHPELTGAVHTLTPGANLGTRMMTLVPAPGAVSMTRPKSSPNEVRSRASTLPRPTESRVASPASTRRTFSGSSPAPSSSTSMTAS